MSNKTIKPEGMRMEVKVKKDTEEIKTVRMVFLEGEDEIRVKMSPEFLKAIRDAAEAIISKTDLPEADRKLPGYL